MTPFFRIDVVPLGQYILTLQQLPRAIISRITSVRSAALPRLTNASLPLHDGEDAPPPLRPVYLAHQSSRARMRPIDGQMSAMQYQGWYQS